MKLIFTVMIWLLHSRIPLSEVPSKKLSELYNGLVTTITSGGILSNFFDQRVSDTDVGSHT